MPLPPNRLSPERQRGLDDIRLGRRPPRVYLASALSNAELNTAVAEALAASSWSCFVPQRDAPADGGDAAIAAANIAGLLEADVVLVLGYNMGRDTAWEAGFATGHGIPVVLAYSGTGASERDIMLFHSAMRAVCVPAGQAPALLPSLLNDIVTGLHTRRQEA